jgi:subtilisin family serine protease
MDRLALLPSSRPVSTVVSLLLAGALAASAFILSGAPVRAQESSAQRYIVVFAGDYALDGTFALGGNYALNHEYALTLVEATGGTVTADLSKQIGVMVVASANALFADTLRTSALVEEVGSDLSWKAFLSLDEAMASADFVDDVPPGQPICFDERIPTPVAPCLPPAGDDSLDPLEFLQWDMRQICASYPAPDYPVECDQDVHAIQDGVREVDVGVLDTGIDGQHVDLKANVDCSRGRNSLAVLPPGVAVGTTDPCIDNGFHGTHVAGTIGAVEGNGFGIVGVAPDVTMVPVKVCDSTGYCYASAVVDGITYSGDQKFDVINMSFFVDDNSFQQSTEFKCASDETQRTFRHAVERAIQYARSQGVTPVAALGNSDQDLAHPVDDEGQPISNECEVVPAETQGVIGTMALGRQSEKASYSNYGTGATDVAAPGGNGGTVTGFCTRTILSTFPGNTYACISGTSMASPHAAGVAALIVSQFGTLGSDGDVKLSPTKVESYLQSTAIDIGLPGYDECFGNGRIHALRAVLHDTSKAYDASAPHCAEYSE